VHHPSLKLVWDHHPRIQSWRPVFDHPWKCCRGLYLGLSRRTSSMEICPATQNRFLIGALELDVRASTACKATAAETSQSLKVSLLFRFVLLQVEYDHRRLNRIDWHSCFVGTTHQEWNITARHVRTKRHASLKECMASQQHDNTIPGTPGV